MLWRKKKVDAILSFKDENHYQVTYANTDPSKTNMTRQVINSTLKQVQVQELIDSLKEAQQANLQAQVQANGGKIAQVTGRYQKPRGYQRSVKNKTH